MQLKSIEAYSCFGSAFAHSTLSDCPAVGSDAPRPIEWIDQVARSNLRMFDVASEVLFLQKLLGEAAGKGQQFKKR